MTEFRALFSRYNIPSYTCKYHPIFASQIVLLVPVRSSGQPLVHFHIGATRRSRVASQWLYQERIVESLRRGACWPAFSNVPMGPRWSSEPEWLSGREDPNQWETTGNLVPWKEN